MYLHCSVPDQYSSILGSILITDTIWVPRNTWAFFRVNGRMTGDLLAEGLMQRPWKRNEEESTRGCSDYRVKSRGIWRGMTRIPASTVFQASIFSLCAGNLPLVSRGEYTQPTYRFRAVTSMIPGSRVLPASVFQGPSNRKRIPLARDKSRDGQSTEQPFLIFIRLRVA